MGSVESTAAAGVRHSPLESELRDSGATIVREYGIDIVSDFGSVAGEVAVCLRAVGIADRSDLVKLDVHGPAEGVGSVVAAVAGAVPRAGEALHVKRAWWSGVDDERVFVLADPSHSVRLVEALGAAARDHEGVSWTTVSELWAVIAVIGPRANALMANLADPALLPDPGGVVEMSVAGPDVVLVRESAQEFLVSVAPQDAPRLWRALHDAGKALGVASVGREAHERFEIAAGIRRSRSDHSGW